MAIAPSSFTQTEFLRRLKAFVDVHDDAAAFYLDALDTPQMRYPKFHHWACGFKCFSLLLAPCGHFDQGHFVHNMSFAYSMTVFKSSHDESLTPPGLLNSILPF
jgi:hypothetical protein